MADLNENNDNIEIKGNEDSAPSERVRKMKQKLERLVMKMKQPDEEELNEEELLLRNMLYYTFYFKNPEREGCR